jgi:hypothetical protein
MPVQHRLRLSIGPQGKIPSVVTAMRAWLADAAVDAYRKATEDHQDDRELGRQPLPEKVVPLGAALLVSLVHRTDALLVEGIAARPGYQRFAVRVVLWAVNAATLELRGRERDTCGTISPNHSFIVFTGYDSFANVYIFNLGVFYKLEN